MLHWVPKFANLNATFLLGCFKLMSMLSILHVIVKMGRSRTNLHLFCALLKRIETRTF